MRQFCLGLAASFMVAGVASAQSPSGILQVSGGCAGGCGVAPSVAVVAAPAAGATCGCDLAGPVASRSVVHRVLSPLFIGQGCATKPGCSNVAAERTFIFGSCNQFFNPGNKCGTGKCGPGMLFGQGNLGNSNNCVYGTYLNR